MATKTFEELKQLAIQIRDEKTNKQNTATRIGTQMLEHLNKLEQDYYDKTATDEELKQRDEKLSELSSVLRSEIGRNFGIKYINLVGNTKFTSLCLTTLSNTDIRIDALYENEKTYTYKSRYLYADIETANQRQGLETIKLKSNYEELVGEICLVIDYDDNILEGKPLNLENRQINPKIIHIVSDEKEYSNKYFDNFSDQALVNYTLSSLISDMYIDSPIDVPIYFSKLYLDRVSGELKFVVNEAIYNRIFINLSIDIKTADKEEYIFNGTHKYIEEGLVIKWYLKLNIQRLKYIYDYTKTDITLYGGTSSINNINCRKINTFDVIHFKGSDILNGRGYVVGNGNTLTTSPNYHWFSDYIRICDGDDISIISMNNNGENATFGYVVCCCSYDNDLNLNTRIENKDEYHLYHIATNSDSYLRVSCSDAGKNTFRLLIIRNKESMPTIKSIKSLKRCGDIGETYRSQCFSASKVDGYNIAISSAKLPSLSKLKRVEVPIHFRYTSDDGEFSEEDVSKSAIFQFIDKRGYFYFSANIGWVPGGNAKRTIFFYSDDDCKTFKLLWDAKELLMDNWEIPVLHVTDEGIILFTRSEENSTGKANYKKQSVWAIEGWQQGSITEENKDELGNAVVIKRKFYLSYTEWVADREDLDFRQYGQETWPDYGYLVGTSYAGTGRLHPGWSIMSYDNIVIISEYGQGDSYWQYKNMFKDVIVNGKHTVSGINNGLGVSRHAWISFDYGKTFKICLDLHKRDETQRWYHCGDAECSHVHAVNYNPYDKRFYAVNGDLERGEDIIGYEDWMHPNQGILYISVEEMKKWYDNAAEVDNTKLPSELDTENTTPIWNRIPLPVWMDEGYGHTYFLQFGTIEPYPNYTLFSTDCDKTIGFWRLQENKLDWCIDTRFGEKDKQVSRSHFGGDQQLLKGNIPRIISVATHNTNSINYLLSCEDGNEYRVIYEDELKEMGWGCLHFYTPNGIYVRKGHSSKGLIKLAP